MLPPNNCGDKNVDELKGYIARKDGSTNAPSGSDAAGTAGGVTVYGASILQGAYLQ
jgi:hypothetical protein